MTSWVRVVVMVALLASRAGALEIGPVRADVVSFDPRRGEAATIRFRVSDKSTAVLRVYDARGYLVRAIALPETAGGDHEVSWDGRSDAGEPVPAGGYLYTLSADSGTGAAAGWDPSLSSLGEPMSVTDLSWDPNRGTIRYVLPEVGRVNIRIGLAEGGPLLRTLVDWAAREAGIREEAWNGRDESGLLDLSQHPNLRLSATAFSLPINTLLVAPPQPRPVFLADLSDAQRHPHLGAARDDWRSYADQRAEERRDVPLTLTVPDSLPRDPDGTPVVSGPVPLRVEIPDPADRERMLRERFEVAFFLDGIYRFENEVGYLPTSWVWDPGDTSEGVHYVTANLLGYEGHFGVATVRLRVARSER